MASDASAQTIGRSRRHVLLARVLAGLTLVSFAIGLVFTFLDASIRPAGAGDALGDLVFVVSFAMFPVIGYVLAIRRPENSIGWLMLGIGTFFGVTAIVTSVGAYLLHSGDRAAGLVLIAFDSPSWLPIVVLPVTFLLLLFPDGHLPSPRWRWFAWSLGVALTVVYLAILLDPGPMVDSLAPTALNPLGIHALGPFLDVAQALILVIPIGAIASLTALVLRFRRSSGVERLQLRWLLTAAVFVAVLYSGAIFASLGSSWGGGGDEPGWLSVLQNIVIPSFALIPLAIGVSILRFRLFDIDVVVNRAVLFGALAVFITVIYVAIVVGIGTLVGGRTDPLLSAAAAAVVALAFQPVRRRAQRFADRLVYGKRATPYEVLSEFSDRVGNAYANEELLPRMARALASGTGAVRTDVWVRIGDQLRSDATWPEDAAPADAIGAGSADATSSSTSMFEPVRHQGELLGGLSIEKKPGDAITATEEKLVRDLAAQAGLVMRNVALTEQLMDHIAQLRASRQRLVSAQDHERRRLERNLHDGAQQQLVALAVKLRLAEQLAERDPPKVKGLLADLQAETGDALENLRDLARGIYPPLLADKGLVAALESQARKSVVPVTIEADGIGRYPQEAEAAVYFSCLEALQNVAKYASASRATVSLSDGDGRLRFEVTDDGSGFEPSEASHGSGLQGIADRLAALDGELEVRSSPGAGTTVAGVLPVAAEPPS
jgi:signal transduction histidine kinase